MSRARTIAGDSPSRRGVPSAVDSPIEARLDWIGLGNFNADITSGRSCSSLIGLAR